MMVSPHKHAAAKFNIYSVSTVWCRRRCTYKNRNDGVCVCIWNTDDSRPYTTQNLQGGSHTKRNNVKIMKPLRRALFAIVHNQNMCGAHTHGNRLMMQNKAACCCCCFCTMRALIFVIYAYKLFYTNTYVICVL